MDDAKRDDIDIELRHTYERVPRRLWIMVLALVGWLIVPWALLLTASIQGDYILGVCAVFTVISFTIAAISVHRALRARRARSAPRGSWLRERLATCTGALPMRAAVIQLLIVPVAVAVGFTLLAVVDVVERTIGA